MLSLIIITAIALYGTKVTWLEGMIFEKPVKWLDKVLGESLIRKPLYACPACMASIWGSAVYWANYGSNIGWFKFFMWPVFCFAVSGLVWVLMLWFPYEGDFNE